LPLLKEAQEKDGQQQEQPSESQSLDFGVVVDAGVGSLLF